MILSNQKFSLLVKTFIIFFFMTLSISIVHRAVAVRVYYIDVFRRTYPVEGWRGGFESIWNAHSGSIFLGVSSDILFSAVFAALLAIIARHRWVVFFAFTLLVFFYAANYEHIKYNFSHINLRTIGEAFSFTFIAGQTTPSFAKNLLLLSFVCAIVWYLMKIGLLRRIGGGLALLLIIGSVFFPIKFSYFVPDWMQVNALLPRVANAKVSTELRESEVLDTADFVTFPISEPKHNVLLIYLEGLSVGSIEHGDMKFLATLAKENISINRYFGNNILTINGLYSTLTGDFPNFHSKHLKWHTVEPLSEVAQRAVPTQLSAAGYQTAFLQSAPLGFMNKEPILRNLGFSDVLGLESWDRAYARNAWGIDDRALFEHTLDYIDSIDTAAPWFIGLLTTGTHSPYNIPEGFLPNQSNDRYRSLSYLDAAIENLMQGLKERDLLSNTVVIFTSDESREPSLDNPMQDRIHLHWLPLLIVHPSQTSMTIEAFIGSHRFPDILSKFIGEIEPASVNELGNFQEPLIFANPYSNTLLWFDTKRNELLFCKTADYECAVFEDVKDPLQISERHPERIMTFPLLRKEIERLEQ